MAEVRRRDTLVIRNVSNAEFAVNNPNCLPLDELELSVTSAAGKEYILSALSPPFRDTIRPLTIYTKPPSYEDGKLLNEREIDDWIKKSYLVISDLKWLLSLNTHRFWSQVLYRQSSLDAVKSFVMASQPFETDGFSYYRRIEKVNEIFVEIETLVFEVFLRLLTNKESEVEWFRKETVGQMIYDNYLITVPFLMRMCVCFHHGNRACLLKAISRAFTLNEDFFIDLVKTFMYLSNKLFEIKVEIKKLADNWGKKIVESDLTKELGVEHGVGIYEELIRAESYLTNKSKVKNGVGLFKDLIHVVFDNIHSLTSFASVFGCAALCARKLRFDLTLAYFYETCIPVMCSLVRELRAKDFPDYVSYGLNLDIARREICYCLHLIVSSSVKTDVRYMERYAEDAFDAGNKYVKLFYHQPLLGMIMNDYRNLYLEKDLQIIVQSMPDISFDELKASVFAIIESRRSIPKIQCVLQRFKVERSQSKTDVEPNEEIKSKTDVEPNEEINSEQKIDREKLESLVAQVAKRFPDLNTKFIKVCLKYYKYSVKIVLNHLLKGTLDDRLCDPTKMFSEPFTKEDINSDM